MSPDWSEGPDPIPYADITNPQSLNLYSYVRNNPLSMADEDGHDGASATASCSGPLCWLYHAFRSIGNGIASGASSIGSLFTRPTQQQQGNALRTYYGGLSYNGTDLGSLSDRDIIQFNQDHRQELAQIHWAISAASVVGGSMLGAKGPQIDGKTLWQSGPTERIDVENPNPGQRPGQIHYQDSANNKYIYNAGTGKFDGLSASQSKQLLSKPGVQAAINKGLRFLGEGK